MPKREMVKVFAEEMELVLDEKFDKYQDSWKDEPLDSLGYKLQEQVSKFALRNLLEMSDEDIMRILAHIGNFTCFIFTRLNK